jgi:anti-sigma regulatory factor (Ser/Thr protein kinase)
MSTIGSTLKSTREVAATMAEGLVLTFPNEPRFLALVRLVLSGLAAQLDLPYERVDDLQLAVEGALASEGPAGGEVTLRFEPGKHALLVLMSPVAGQSLAEGRPERGNGLGFDRIAAELVDSVEVVTIDGKDWLRLEKRIPARAGTS